MKAIAFYNNKGGVGKTTLSTQLAVFSGAFQQKKNSKLKVLFIDLDEQMNGTQFLTQLDDNAAIRAQYPVDICALIEDESIDPTKAVYSSVYPHVDFIPGSESIKAIASKWEKDTTGFGQLILNKQIRKIEADYDYAFIDCPPTKSSGETAMGMMLADGVVIPILPDVYSLNGLVSCAEMIDNVANTAYRYTGHHLLNLGTVLNQYQANESLNKFFVDTILPTYDFPFSGITIRKAAKISQNNWVKETLVNADRACKNLPQTTKAADDFFRFALYIFKSLKEGKRCGNQ